MKFVAGIWYEVVKDIYSSIGYGAKVGTLIKFIDDFTPRANDKNLVKVLTKNDDVIKKQYLQIACDVSIEKASNQKEIQSQVDALISRNIQASVVLTANITTGADPEIFITTKSGEVIPAFEFLSKDNPKSTWSHLGFMQDGSTAMPDPYWDGFQAEVKIYTSACHAYVVDAIQQQLKRLKALAPLDSILNAQPTHIIPASMLKEAKPEHVALGCMPSRNAYGMEGVKVDSGLDLPYRFAGFHIHWTTDNKSDIEKVVKTVDNIAGVMSVVTLNGLENAVRRQYYGLAGEFRTPKYGLEYRVLSSAVLWHPSITHLHLDMARGALQIAKAGLGGIWNGSEEETIDIINNLDVDQAKKAMKRNKDLYFGLLERYYPSLKTNPTTLYDSVLTHGFKDLIDLDINKNWLLEGGWASHSEGAGVQMIRFAPKTKTMTA